MIILRKKISFAYVVLLSLMMVGCIDNTGHNKEQGLIIDYNNAEDFESALNNDEDVTNKVVKFEVNDYKEDSALGINCWAGEHLNFISEEPLDVERGDYIIAHVVDTPSKVLFSSWMIPYEVITIEYSNTNNQDENNNNENKNDDIIVSFDSDSFIGKKYKKIENQFYNLGFSNITLKAEKTSDLNYEDDTISSILINGSKFNKGDIFQKDDKVVINYWEYEKPKSEYELAFVRELSSYELYYMFDLDEKKVVYFGTNDTYVDKGTYSGNFSSGVTIKWEHGEFTEQFTHKDESNFATLRDGNGFDWNFEVCELTVAQQILDSLQ